MKYIHKTKGEDAGGHPTHIYTITDIDGEGDVELLFFQKCHPDDRGSAMLTVRKDTGGAKIETYYVLTKEMLQELVQVIKRECK
jgi:hypothetical protein